jgi:hypothetical protein
MISGTDLLLQKLLVQLRKKICHGRQKIQASAASLRPSNASPKIKDSTNGVTLLAGSPVKVSPIARDIPALFCLCSDQKVHG